MGKSIKVSNKFFSFNKSLKRSIQAAEKGDQILIRKGTYEVNGVINIEKDIELIGEKEKVVLESSIYINNGARVKIKGITIANLDSNGIEIVNGMLEMENCIIQDINGRGINVSSMASLKIKGCDLSNNEYGIYSKGTIDVDDCSFREHVSPQILVSRKSASIRNCTIHNGKGNGIRIIENGHASIQHCRLHGHKEYSQVSVEDSTLEVRKSKIFDGLAGIHISNAKVKFNDSEVSEHQNSQLFIDGKAELSLYNSKVFNGNSNGILLKGNSFAHLEDCFLYGHQAFPQMFIDEGSKGVLKNCKVYDGTSAIEVINSVVEIATSEINNHTLSQLYLDQKSEISLKQTVIADGKDLGISLLNNSYGKVEDCTFYGHHEKSQMLIRNSELQVLNTDIFDGCQAIQIMGSKVHIQACEIYNHTKPQLASVSSNFEIQNTTIRNGGGVGIAVIGSKGKISNCEIYEHLAHAQLFFRDETEVTLLNSKIYRGGTAGLVFNKGSKGLVEDCEIYDHKNGSQIMMINSNPKIKNCRITKGKSGVEIISSSPKLSGCVLKEHEEADIIQKENAISVIEHCHYDTIINLPTEGHKENPS
jgi:F-box protein 11